MLDVRRTWMMVALVAGWIVAGAAVAADGHGASKSHAFSRADATAIIAAGRRVVSGHGIEQNLAVPVDGIRQWLSIRGHDLRNPILLVLHGGPGAPAIPGDWTYQSAWEDYFTVVQWDQRGAGKTYAANTEAQMAAGMTIQGMTDDAAGVVQYLRKRFDKRRIFLLGHSWGSVLGVHLAQQHPDWFYAYIGVGQVVNTRRGEQAGYRFTLAQARADHNAEAVKELEALAPYPGKAGLTPERITVRDKWEMYYGGLAWGRRGFGFEAGTWELSPDYSEAELDAIDKGSAFSLKYLLQPMIDVDFDDVTDFRCPVILFAGAHDETTPHTLVEQWFARIEAPSKRLVEFADSAHLVMQEQPGRFLVHLVTDALPLAIAAGDAAPAEKVKVGAGDGD